MEFKTLKKLFISYNKVFTKGFIYTIENDNSVEIDFKNLINDIFHYLKKIVITEPIENNHLQNMKLRITYTDNYESPEFLLTKLNKYKEVIFNELVYFIEKYFRDDGNFKIIKSTLDELLIIRDNFVDRVIKLYYKNQLNENEPEYNVIKYKEYKLFHDIIRYEKNIYKLEENNISWIFENNHDNIIKYEKTELLFKFENNKTYNVWEDDHSPKVILKNIDSSKDYNFEFDIDFIKSNEQARYHAGIFLKTEKEETYFIGIFCNTQMKIEKFYKDEKLFFHTKVLYENNIDSKSNFRIQLKKEINNYKISLDGMNCFTISDICELDYLSIGCKTWDNPLPLEFKIENIYYELSDSSH
jgi:hypothetical protein